MNKTLIITLAVAAGVVFNVADAAGKKKKDRKGDKADAKVELKTAGDSLSYAAGLVRTDGLLPFLKQNYGVDTAYMADFTRGFEDAMNRGIDEKTKAYYAGEQVALMVSQRMLPFLKEEFAGQTDSVSDALFVKGFVNSLKKDMSVMPDSVASEYFNAAFMKAINDRNMANKKAGEDFLARNKRMAGVLTLPSGLQYKMLKRGNGPVAGVNDEVTVKYEGRLIDGTVFDSSYKRKDQTSTFRPNQVIEGWTEALTMMPVGSKWELYIPYYLAYKERQAGKIKPFSALIFTVEVVDVKKAEADTAKPKVSESKSRVGVAKPAVTGKGKTGK